MINHILTEKSETYIAKLRGRLRLLLQIPSSSSLMTSFFKIDFPKSSLLNFRLIEFSGVLNSTHFRYLLHSNQLFNSLKIENFSNYDVISKAYPFFIFVILHTLVPYFICTSTRFSFLNEIILFLSRYRRKSQYCRKWLISPNFFGQNFRRSWASPVVTKFVAICP